MPGEEQSHYADRSSSVAGDRGMRVRVELGERLRRVDTEAHHRPDGWTPALVRSCRMLIQRVRAARDVGDLTALASVGLERPVVGPCGRPLLRLGHDVRLILTFIDGSPDSSVLLEVEERYSGEVPS